MNIYESIPAVMADCKAVGKDSKNPQQGYSYRGIDAVTNMLQPALIKHKVFVVPEVLEQTREERVNAKGTLLIYSIAKIRYSFFAEDGSSVQSTVIGEGMDTGDKSMNKAMSAAFKYALFQTFCIPTEEMQDSEKDSPEPMPKTEKITQMEAETLKALFKASGKSLSAFLKSNNLADVSEVTPAQYAYVVKALKKNEDKRDEK